MRRIDRPYAAAAGIVLVLAVVATLVSASVAVQPQVSKTVLVPADSSCCQTKTFAKDIKPLADARCKGCHGATMSDYSKLISSKLVVPNKPDESKYYLKPSGKAQHGGGDVWKDKADLVKAWIASGAPK